MKTKTDLLCKNGLGDSSTVCTKELKALASTSETITRQGCHPSRFWRGRPVFHPFCPVEIPNRTSNIPFSDLTVRSGYRKIYSHWTWCKNRVFIFNMTVSVTHSIYVSESSVWCFNFNHDWVSPNHRYNNVQIMKLLMRSFCTTSLKCVVN